MINLLIGIITYNPDIDDFKESLISVFKQCNNVLIVDNGSDNKAELDVAIKDVSSSIHCVYNSSNLGIAKALNQIVDFAKDNDYKWFMTLDQDSRCADELVRTYEQYIESKTHEDIACITCNIVDNNISYLNDAPEGQCQDIEYCITSGSCMNTQIVSQIGGFDDVMFIDKVDTDICVNIRRSGYRIVRVNFDGLYHEIGHARRINIGIRTWDLYNHNKMRRYYMCRNAVYIHRKYRCKYTLKVLVGELFMTLMVLLFENNKRGKFASGFKGYVDGIKMAVK